MTRRIHVLLFVMLVLISTNVGAQSKGKNKEKEKKFIVDPYRHDNMFLSALVYKAKGDKTSFVRALHQCLKEFPRSAETLAELSQYYLSIGEVSKSVSYIKRAIEIEDNNYWYYKLYVSALRLSPKEYTDEQISENRRERLKTLEKMSKLFTDKEEVLMELIDTYVAEKDYKKALSAIDELESRFGGIEEIGYNKSLLLFELQEYDKGIETLEEFVSKYPTNAEAKAMFIRAYYASGKKDMAHKKLEKFIAEDPDNPDLLKMSLPFYAQKDEKKYLALLKQIAINDEANQEDRAEMINRLYSAVINKEITKAEFHGVIDQIIDDADPNMQIVAHCLSILKNMDDKDQLISVIKKISDKDLMTKELYLIWVSTLLNEKKTDDIVEVGNKAVKQFPQEIIFRYLLGLAYYEKDMYDEAIRSAKEGINLVDEESDKDMVSSMYEIVGNAEHTKGNNKVAYEAYDKALEYNPNNVGILNNYAYYLSVERKNLDKAEAMANKAIKLQPDNPTFIDTYAWVLFVKGRYKEAQKYIETIADNISSDVVCEHFGDIYYMNGEKEKAIEYWNRAKEMGNKSKVLDRKIKEKKYIKE